MTIILARSEGEIATARELFCEYASSIPVDLSYQGFGNELDGLPGAYAEPRGRLLLGFEDSHCIGCAALRPLSREICEMKRLYVRPAGQGRGWGRGLACRLIHEAREIGYLAMYLDTLPTMVGAIRLYESLGFVRREPYYATPIEGTVSMELALNSTH